MTGNNHQANPLVSIGLTAYYTEHPKILEEICPNGNFSSAEWNEASVEAIIKAVSVMIEENNTLIQANAERPKADV